jgi:hypothetical protein
MRQTVDERLQSTLEKRLGESFKMVSKHLEAVQRGLGEMQSLATGVGDLKRVLTNVKARGVWGEVQLGALLEQILTVDQYAKNVYTREGSQEFVEYAVRLPGTDDDPGSCVWLPIDSKFPQEDYLRLADAADTCDVEAVQRATAGFIRAVHVSAKDLGTGREQKITITASSGLDDSEIERMVNESEANAEEDQKRRRSAEAKNRGDSLVYNTEKILDEHGDKIDNAVKDQVKKTVEDLKKSLEKQDAEEIEAACDKVEKMAQKLGEAVYAKAAADKDNGAAQPEAAAEDAAKQDEDVVDAEYQAEDSQESKK